MTDLHQRQTKRPKQTGKDGGTRTLRGVFNPRPCLLFLLFQAAAQSSSRSAYKQDKEAGVRATSHQRGGEKTPRELGYKKKKKKQTLVTYRQKKIAPHCLVSGWERINGPPINKITKKGNGHNIRDFPLWNGPLPALLGKSCFMSKLSPPHHHMHHLSPLFQHISDPNSNVNSHFSHRQGRMRSVCVCVCVCGCGCVCVCVFRRRGWRGLVVPWRTCGTTNEQCLEQYQRCRWEEIWMACQWRRWLLLMSVVETMSALGHLSLSLELFFLSYPGVSR